MPDKFINFPCQFPIKIMGLANDTFEAAVVAILNQHLPNLREVSMIEKLSTRGKFKSIPATVNAKSQAQLDAIYGKLTQDPNILMVL